ncbi:MAG: hypothetical protein K8R48_02380 [Alphaproteobacteria bacterium]|nr:hypothetical protein [Alphaproteobacteria bacterium]
MAHDMYGINELLKKYPLAEDVFNKTEEGLEAAFFAMGGEAAVIAGPKLILETIDRNIDGTDAQKQALIIGVMYSMSFSSLKEDLGSFGVKYGPEVRAVIDDILDDEKKLAADKNSVAAESVSRISAVLGICTMGLFTSTLAEAGAAVKVAPPQLVQQMKSTMLEQEKQFLPSLNAPRLETLYQQKKQGLFAVLDKMAAGPQPKNKKPGGPKA